MQSWLIWSPTGFSIFLFCFHLSHHILFVFWTGLMHATTDRWNEHHNYFYLMCFRELSASPISLSKFNNSRQILPWISTIIIIIILKAIKMMTTLMMMMMMLEESRKLWGQNSEAETWWEHTINISCAAVACNTVVVL